MHPLHSLAPLRFTGPDARSFLQGQLTQDMDSLTPNTALLASCNSSQGRVQAVLRLIQRQDGILALLPHSLIDVTLHRLRKYVLRAKLGIEDAHESLRIYSADRDDLAREGWTEPSIDCTHVQNGNTSILRWSDGPAPRFLVIRPSSTETGLPEANRPEAEQAWQLADIRAGLPQVFPETHERFVAQMLNLDVLNGISFNKGCYTGQEIIARAHFRGTVKRRMFRLRAACPAPTPGARIVNGGEHVGDVVVAANTETGSELLAVLSLAQSSLPLSLETNGTALDLLSLPYEIPTLS